MALIFRTLVLALLAAVLGAGLGTAAAPRLVPFVEAKLLAKAPDAKVASLQVVPAPVEIAEAELFTVEPTTLRRTVPFTGTLEPVRRVSVKAEVAAPVADVLVRAGEAVRKGDVLVRIDMADLQSALAEREANLEGAQAQLDLARKNRDAKVKLATKGFAARQTVNEVKAAFDAAEASVRALKAQLEIARKALDKAEVKAPMDGVVAERAVDPGDKVAVDAKLLTLVSLDEMEIAAPVPASEIGRVAAGQPVTFHVPGLDGGAFTGAVARINPVAQAGTRSIPVYVSVANGGGLLRGGMFAEGEIVVREDVSALAVPREAVRGEGAGSHVLKLEGGRILRQPVVVAEDARDEDPAALSQVMSGLTAGDTIIAVPAIDLAPGTPIRVSQR